jgi:hypothetical protein
MQNLQALQAGNTFGHFLNCYYNSSA